MGAGCAALKGVSNDSCEDWSHSFSKGLPIPIGSDLEKCGLFDIGGGGNAGPLHCTAGARGGAIGVPLMLDEAEFGVCACDKGCGCNAPAPPRGKGVGRPMRPASKVDFRKGV